MARGITQAQVNGAADAILGAGENPTVEKVRAALGTGSPNTIIRMLDAWRGQLGDRLRQLSALPEVPGPVGQAMLDLWRLAADQAERVLEGRFAHERSALEAAQARLAQEREHWESRLQAAEISVAQAQTARDLAEHACSTLDDQLQDSHALRADLVQQRDRLQALADQQQADINALRAERAASDIATQKERERQAEYMRNVENRAHQEIDRARQEAKALQQHLEQMRRDHQHSLTEAERQRDSLRTELRKAEQEAANHAGRATALEIALAQAHAPTTKRAHSNRSPAKAAPTKPQRSGQSRTGKSKRKDK